MKLHAYPLIENTDMLLPAMLARIPAGEPMALGDEIEYVDLNYLLTRGSPNSLVLRVDGDSMCDDISSGDYIVVSKDVRPEIGDIVVASINGEHTLKRLKASDRKLYLVPSNTLLKPREMHAGDDFTILAVVMKVIKSVR